MDNFLYFIHYSSFRVVAFWSRMKSCIQGLVEREKITLTMVYMILLLGKVKLNEWTTQNERGLNVLLKKKERDMSKKKQKGREKNNSRLVQVDTCVLLAISSIQLSGTLSLDVGLIVFYFLHLEKYCYFSIVRNKESSLTV